jgi:hypothetical protein
MVDCEVSGNAGGIEAGALTVNGGTIRNNVSPSTSGGGGGIYSPAGRVTLNSVRITDNATGGRGGGVYVYEGTLDVTDCVIEGNSARSGGGIYQGDVWQNGSLTVLNSTISGNTATNEGGGIRSGNIVLTGSVVSDNRAVAVLSHVNSLGGGISVRGTATIRDSTVTNNSTSGVAGGVSAIDVTIERSNISGNSTTGENGFGGGIYAFDSVSVLNSTVAGNFTTGAGAGGGGIASDRVTITQSTISGNRTEGASAHGGGISASGFTVVSHSTIADNHALHETATGGGLWKGGSQTTISGSILANNSAGGGSPDLRALSSPVNPLPVSYSLIGDTDGLITSGPGNLTNVDPMLGPLAYNGGPTFADGSEMLTHALLPGSPAIDAGDPSAAAGVNGVPMFDQRGGPFGRVVDGDGMVGARIDMGALERQPNPLPADYNFNGVVDAADYVLWRKNFGVPTVRGDGDGDGDVDQNDYGVWRTNFGSAYADEPAAASTTIVDRNGLQGIGMSSTARQASSGTRVQVRHGGSVTSGGTTALPDDLALLAWLRTAGGTAADESDDDFQDNSADTRPDSEDGSRQAMELVFAELGAA